MRGAVGIITGPLIIILMIIIIIMRTMKIRTRKTLNKEEQE